MELREARAGYLVEAGQRVPKGYKQTEVGVIPEDWDFDFIDNLAHITTGGKNTQDRVDDGEYPFFVRSQTAERINSYSFDGEAVLTAGDGVGTGKVFHYINGKFDAHQRVYRISDFNERINGYFFYLYFSSYFYNRIMQMTAKSSVDSVRMEMIAKMPIPLPPTKAEQEAIAEALSDADALIESLEQLITKKRHIKQGVMQELLSPKPGDDVRLLRDVSTLKGRIGWQGLNQTEFTSNDDEPFLITGMNFKDGAIRWNEVYHIPEPRYEMAKDIQLRSEDVLMTKDGTIGKVLYIDNIPCPGKASLNSHLLLFRPIRESYNSRYLYYQLGSQRFKDFIELSKYGTTFFGISQAAVGNYPVLLPPIENQVRIASILSDMDSEIAALEERLAKTRAIKQGMMHNLLTGKVRLVDPAIAKIEQHALLDVESIPAAPKLDKSHNWAFNEAVVIAVLADLFVGKPEFPLGRKRYTKLSYLMHRKAEQEVQGYLKKAAGPYNPKTKYAGPEKIAQENGYMRWHENGKYKGFIAGEKIEQAKAYFIKWYGVEITAWLEQFRYRSNDDLELFATVDMAMQELLKQGKAADVDRVRALIASEPEWLPKLERSTFSDSGIAAAIAECQAFFTR